MKDYGKVITIDLGGTNLRAAVVNRSKIIEVKKVKTPNSKKELLSEITNLISGFFDNSIKGIGISAPGPLREGKILNSPNIPLKNFDLKKYISKRFRVRVEVENDANCVALAERDLGIKKKDFFVLTLGTGIGGGVIINGEIFNKQDIGAELGYIFIEKNKSLEDLAGFKAISKITKKSFGREIYVKKLIKMKDKKAKKIIENLTDNLAQGIGSLINVFNPEVVVLAGGMSESGNSFLNSIRKKSKRYILLPKKYSINYSKLKEPGLLGASLLFRK